MPIYYLTISLYPFSSELGYRQLFVFIYDGLRPTVYARFRTDLFECSLEFSVVSYIKTGYI